MPVWGPNKVGRNQKLLHHRCLVTARKPGQRCYVSTAFSGVPQETETTSKALPHACVLLGPEEGGIAT